MSSRQSPDEKKPVSSRSSAIPQQMDPEIAAGLAHTVQTPLQSIIINSELLMELLRQTDNVKLRDKGLKILSRINREAASLQSIVKDFLALVRLTTGKAAATDANYLVREVVEFMRVECLKYGIDIALNLDVTIYPVTLDRSLISHALMNLIRNAREAIGHDGLIEVSTRENGDFLEIEIRDDGSGILRDNEPRIFEPFFTTKAGGTGLGLPIAKRILEAHGGDLFLRPETERGAAFVMQIPRGKFLSHTVDNSADGTSGDTGETGSPVKEEGADG
ncbi:MAG: ATP-binding protein [Candidatus Brocadiia bacterium]